MWTLAGLVALDVVIAGVFAACAAGYRYRGLRQLRHLEAMWHAEPHHASSYPWVGRRVRRRRVIAPVVLATMVVAGTAMANQGDVVGSALDTLATRLGIGPDRQVTVVAAPVSEDAAGPTSRTPPGQRSGAFEPGSRPALACAVATRADGSVAR